MYKSTFLNIVRKYYLFKFYCITYNMSIWYWSSGNIYYTIVPLNIDQVYWNVCFFQIRRISYHRGAPKWSCHLATSFYDIFNVVPKQDGGALKTRKDVVPFYLLQTTWLLHRKMNITMKGNTLKSYSILICTLLCFFISIYTFLLTILNQNIIYHLSKRYYVYILSWLFDF